MSVSARTPTGQDAVILDFLGAGPLSTTFFFYRTVADCRRCIDNGPTAALQRVSWHGIVEAWVKVSSRPGGSQ
jgi:hypothetical protein